MTETLPPIADFIGYFVRIWDNGWYHVRLLEVGPKWARIESIGAYSRANRKRKILTSELELPIWE